jgi:hypothetical protein
MTEMSLASLVNSLHISNGLDHSGVYLHPRQLTRNYSVRTLEPIGVVIGHRHYDHPRFLVVQSRGRRHRLLPLGFQLRHSHLYATRVALRAFPLNHRQLKLVSSGTVQGYCQSPQRDARDDTVAAPRARL